MQITKEWLKEEYVCPECLDWFLSQPEDEFETDLFKLIKKLKKEKHKDWANWLITTAMNRQQQLKYAIACAELVLPIFEKEYPNDNRPRLAIEASAKVLLDDSEENRRAADKAAFAANDYVALALGCAPRAARDAAYDAACAGIWAARAAIEAADAAYDAACAGIWAANAAYYAARVAKWKHVLKIGIKILKGKKTKLKIN